MQIINVTAFKRYFPYANATDNGRELKPGEYGPDIPLSKFFTNPLIKKDIEANITQIRLSEEDRRMLALLDKEDTRKIKVAERPKEQKPVPVKKKPIPKKENKPVSKPIVPTWGDLSNTRPITSEDVASGTATIADLMRNNMQVNTKDAKRAKLNEIQKHMGSIV